MASVAHNLDREIATFERLLPSMAADEGRFALIAGDDLIGVYDTYADALSAGYAARKLAPFLVKRVSTIEVVANFSRSLRLA